MRETFPHPAYSDGQLPRYDEYQDGVPDTAAIANGEVLSSIIAIQKK